ncbi:MAG: hypothetical protein JXA46_17260 [Dehalococcoidales bacterium]|nr:hypothetical protein [Dehalococcoidales bacterium]
MHFVLLVLLSCLLVSVSGCKATSGEDYPGFNRQFDSIVQPYSFNFTRWEIETLAGEILRQIRSPLPEHVLTADSVIDYFHLKAELNSRIFRTELAASRGDKLPQEEDAVLQYMETRIAELKPAVEKTLARQITGVLSEEEIYNPLDSERLKLTFPAVRFKLEKPLNLVVVSPRDRIEKIRDRVLQQDLSADQLEDLESSLDSLDFSSLVVQIGGFGASYPSFVAEGGSLRFTLETAAEEWLHQYLVFKPLGRAYALHLLNISTNEDITILNETVAGLASGEIAGLVYDRYYAHFFEDEDGGENMSTPIVFDFNATMREIRRNVDLYLEQGQIVTAENYMSEMRQYLANNGYYIRKLNQAYFAFHGSYAMSPASIDPVGEQVRTLRKNSLSLGNFLKRVSGLQSREDLAESLEQSKQPAR